jgi:uncharacterized coiled-coil DUF342 family protein
LFEVDRELDIIKERIDRLKLKNRDWIDKRNSIHDQIIKLRRDAVNFRDKREELNQKVKEFKSMRDKERLERGKKRTEIAKLRTAVEIENKNGTGVKKGTKIKKLIRNLEWKIQTVSLTLKEEKLLYNRVKSLEAQLIDHDRLEKMREKYTVLLAESKANEAKAKHYHKIVSESSEKSQVFHEKMLESYDQIHKLQTDADLAHQEHIKVKQKIQEIYKERDRLSKQLKLLKQKNRESEEKRKTELRLKYGEELKKKALDKLKRGDKLTFEEFKILTEQGLL